MINSSILRNLTLALNIFFKLHALFFNVQIKKEITVFTNNTVIKSFMKLFWNSYQIRKNT